ncbi:MAG: retropepsin-like aspartic protease family protein, partial [Sphingomonas sp.]
DRTIIIIGAGAFVVALGGMQLGNGLTAGAGGEAAPAEAAAESAPPPPPARPDPMPEHIGTIAANGDVTLNRQGDGHFHAQLEIGSVAIPMIVDTGATQVVLTQADAERAGIRPSTGDYNGYAETAGGRVLVAPVVLDRVRLGNIELHGVQASVVRGSVLRTSLLGQSVLNRVNSITIEDGQMRLR